MFGAISIGAIGLFIVVAILIQDWIDRRAYAAAKPVRDASNAHEAKQRAARDARDAARQQSAQDAVVRQTAPPGGASMQYMPMQYMPMDTPYMQYVQHAGSLVQHR